MQAEQKRVGKLKALGITRVDRDSAQEWVADSAASQLRARRKAREAEKEVS